MTIPGSNQSLRKVIYMPHWCLIELVGSWSINGPDGLYLQCRLGISILEASFFFLFFIKLSTAATDFETHAKTNHLILDFLGKTGRPYLPPLLPPALLLPHHMLLPHASYLLTGKYFSQHQLPTTIESQGSLTKV